MDLSAYITTTKIGWILDLIGLHASRASLEG